MIRNEVERRNAEKQVEYLRSELEKRTCDGASKATRGAMVALNMQLSDIEWEIDEYLRLKRGSKRVLSAASLDDLGELLIKARISRGWSQAELAAELGMETQQVQRYEKYDWQKISFWRLQEVVDALDLGVEIRADLDGEIPKRPGALWPGTKVASSGNAVVRKDQALTGSNKDSALAVNRESAAKDHPSAAVLVAQDPLARNSEVPATAS